MFRVRRLFNSISQRDLKKKRFHPLTKLVVVLFFFGFDGLAWERHGFLYPWFSFLSMSPCKKVFSSILLALIGCFFFTNLGRIILFSIFSGSAPSLVLASEVDMLFGSTAR